MNQGAKIKEARMAKGMSQNDLAAALGVSAPAISRYELGQRRLRPEQLEIISQTLGIPIIELLDPEPERREELKLALKVLADIQERELEGQYLSDADRWIDQAVDLARRLINHELEKGDKPESPEEVTPELRKRRKCINKINNMFALINDEGLRKVAEYTKDISCIPAYQSPSAADAGELPDAPTDDSQNHI